MKIAASAHHPLPSASFTAASPMFSGKPANGTASSPPAKPYPKPTVKKWFVDALKGLNRLYLRYRLNIQSVTVKGQQRVIDLLNQGHHLMLTPNHPGHGDTLMVTPMYRAIGRPFNILVADFFFTNHFISEKWRHRILNDRGMFPINREILDRDALNTAVEIMKKGENPLVIFPEGISTGQNDELGEVKEGAVMISLNAAKEVAQASPHQHVMMVPVAMRHHFTRDITQGLNRELQRLERQLRLPVGELSKQNPLEGLFQRIETAGQKAMEVREKAILGKSAAQPDMNWATHHQTVMDNIAEAVAQRLKMTFKPGSSILDKHRDLTGKIKLMERAAEQDQITDRDAPKRVAQLKASLKPVLDNLYEMLKLSPAYHTKVVNQHRLAEALYRIDAILNKGRSRVMARVGPRVTAIQMGEPIDVTGCMQQHTGGKGALRAEITEKLRAAIQGMLENNQPKP